MAGHHGLLGSLDTVAEEGRQIGLLEIAAHQLGRLASGRPGSAGGARGHGGRPVVGLCLSRGPTSGAISSSKISPTSATPRPTETASRPPLAVSLNAVPFRRRHRSGWRTAPETSTDYGATR